MNTSQSPILITGGAGYIGSHIGKALAENNQPLVVVDDLSTGFVKALPPGIAFYQENIGNVAKMRQILQDHQIESVIHMAASIAVDESIADPLKYYENNVAHSVALLKACLGAGVRHFVFSSTAAVYGTPERLPVTEATPLKPESPYGAAKAMAERILADAAHNQSLRYVILRYFNVAGAALDGTLGQYAADSSHLIRVACETACGKRDVMSINGDDYPTQDGTAERDFIHIADLVDIHLSALHYLQNGGASEIFNCGYGKGYTVREIIETVKKISGVDFKTKIAARRAGDIARIYTDPAKIKNVLGWTPRYDDIELICKTAFLWEKQRL